MLYGVISYSVSYISHLKPIQFIIANFLSRFKYISMGIHQFCGLGKNNSILFPKTVLYLACLVRVGRPGRPLGAANLPKNTENTRAFLKERRFRAGAFKIGCLLFVRICADYERSIVLNWQKN